MISTLSMSVRFGMAALSESAIGSPTEEINRIKKRLYLSVNK
jgi:hypothetical protein